MNYINLSEVNHEDFDYNSDAFYDFKEPLVIRGGCKDTIAFKNGI